MKKFIILSALFIALVSCQSNKGNNPQKQTTASIKPEKNDDGEWDLVVMDTQWDYFLHAIAKPMDYYSESYLQSKNALLVSEWNSYYYTGRYPNIIESSIDYYPNEHYGKKFEYKLYQVFVYVQWKYGLRLNGLGQADVR